MGDILKEGFINSRPWAVKPFCSDTAYDLEVICVQTGCLRFNVSGKSQLSHIDEISKFIDWDGNEFDVDDFYIENDQHTQTEKVE